LVDFGFPTGSVLGFWTGCDDLFVAVLSEVFVVMGAATVFVFTFVLLVAGAAVGFVVALVFAGSGFFADLSSSLGSESEILDVSELDSDFLVVFGFTSGLVETAVDFVAGLGAIAGLVAAVGFVSGFFGVIDILADTTSLVTAAEAAAGFVALMVTVVLGGSVLTVVAGVLVVVVVV
jgi:hypothetical protein